MLTVYKYSLPLEGVTKISMPLGAVILTLATQKDRPYLWCKVDTDQPLMDRQFLIVGTGHNLDAFKPLVDDAYFIGTFQMMAGELVFHVFEIV